MRVPKKLKAGDEVRVIAPARSLAVISNAVRETAIRNLEKLGLKVTFGKNVEECDAFKSSSVQSRVSDLHDAFRDPNVKGVLTAIGGFNSNQLLEHLDYDLILNNPKVFCGYSDVSSLQNAIYAKTHLVTYSGPHFSTFGMEKGLDYTVDYFKKCLFSEVTVELIPSPQWSDDEWFLNQDQRLMVDNPGMQIINPGSAVGCIVGGNLSTLALLQGTPYMPPIKNNILFLEEDGQAGELSDVEFDRRLHSITQLPDFNTVNALVIGRFQKSSKMSLEKVTEIVRRKKPLNSIPVIYGADFGHTTPHITFPVGGTVDIDALGSSPHLYIIEH